MASNSTPNYGFPVLAENDKPTWLGDFNQAMSEIDAAINDLANQDNDYDARITACLNAANAAQSTANANTNKFSSMGIEGNTDAKAFADSVKLASSDAAEAKQNASTALGSVENAVTAAESATAAAQAASTKADAAMIAASGKLNAPSSAGSSGQVLSSDGMGGTYWANAQGGGGSQYVLPAATAYSLGGVKIGSGVNVSADGTISVDTSGGGGGGEIQPGSITSDKLADDCVTTDKIESNAVTSAKLASNAVTETKIQNNSVTSTKIASGAVGSNQLASSIANDISKGVQAYNFVNTDVMDIVSSKESVVTNPAEFTASAWGNIVVVQVAGVSVPAKRRIKVAQLRAGYYPKRVFTAATVNANGADYEPGFVQVDMNGGVYVNSGGSGTVEPVGCLMFMSNLA